jgi:hypothetical protein
MKQLSAKQKMVKFLKKTSGYNTFTVKQARRYFGVQNVAARIEELRNDGHTIYTNTRKLENGRKVSFYRLGSPTKALVRTALKAGHSMTA